MFILFIEERKSVKQNEEQHHQNNIWLDHVPVDGYFDESVSISLPDNFMDLSNEYIPYDTLFTTHVKGE